MARVEADREDLLREAVALVRRVEFQTNGEESAVVAGFRSTGWLSLYFGPDLMYQFDERGRLRRSYIAGLLYRTQGNALAQLRRERSETETALLRQDLVGEPLAEFRNRAHSKLRWLKEMLNKGELTIARQIPDNDSSLVADVSERIDAVLGSPEFLAPAMKP